MIKKNVMTILAIFVILTVIASFVCAQDDDEEFVTASGLDVGNLLTLASSILALFLFAVTALAYHRDGRSRLLFVSVAFLLFALKGFIASDFFFKEQNLLDLVASFLDFAILACFFTGLMRK